jgi:HPt (histidine-containing phosphotransfer) domain-containing protein
MLQLMIDDIRSELREVAAKTERTLAMRVDHRNAFSLAWHIAELRSLAEQIAEYSFVLRSCRQEGEDLSGMAEYCMELEGRTKEKRNDLMRLASHPNAVEG